MLKLMREASHSYPWLLKSIMGIIALAFVITMGWWGFGEQTRLRRRLSRRSHRIPR